MQINEGDAFVLDNGRTVRVASVYDQYDQYDTERSVGDGTDTYVRHSHWWRDGSVIAPRDQPLDDFLDEVVDRIPSDEVADRQMPDKSRS